MHTGPIMRVICTCEPGKAYYMHFKSTMNLYNYVIIIPVDLLIKYPPNFCISFYCKMFAMIYLPFDIFYVLKDEQETFIRF